VNILWILQVVYGIELFVFLVIQCFLLLAPHVQSTKISRSPAPTKLCPLPSLLTSTHYWNIMFHLVLYALQLQIITRPPCPHRFWVSQFFCSWSYHLEFPSLGYSKQFYHILFSPPTQNLLLQSSFSASLVPFPTPAQRLRFGRSIADIVRFTNSFTYLLTYLKVSTQYQVSIIWNMYQYHDTILFMCQVSVSWYFFLHGININIKIQFKSIIHNTV